jgi:hypothetical protein
MKKQFDEKEYALMASVYEYLIKKGMGFCYLQDGRLIDREIASNYLANNHGAYINAGKQ